MSLLFSALAVLACGSLASLAVGRRSALATGIGAGSVVLATLMTAGASLAVLLGAAPLSGGLPWPVPGGELALQLDPLAAFFVLPISLLALLCAVYAGPYLRPDGEHRSLAPHWFFFNLLVAAMLLVVTAANAVLFLAAWELMTLSSFFLVAWDHRHSEVGKAAWLYLMAAHLGLMLLLALFLQAGIRCGSFNFSDFGPLGRVSPTAAAMLFFLAVGGFGVKAGLFPLHIWLPDAHPAAPSHVSALMSGVLVKTGIYGILRVVSLLPPAPAWWGWVLALLGIGGALYGIALAAVQRDIKRCLAYSTVENVGIIFLGLGVAMVAASGGYGGVAVLALAGGLLHIWNHAMFKGLMFLGAGALLHATGTRDVNHMGGLLRRLPATATLWIGGSLAIGALPPLNGLASEWLIYLGLLNAGVQGTGFAALGPLLLVALLGLTGALALLTFTRLVGICLLGEPRTEAAAQAHEPPFPMRFAMVVLFAGCLAVGVFPQGVLRLLEAPLAFLNASAGQVLLPIAAQLGNLGHWALGLWLALAVMALAVGWLRRRHPVARGTTWGCGFAFSSPRMSYTGEGFAELCHNHLLPKILKPRVDGGKVEGVFPVPAQVVQSSAEPVLSRLLIPLFEGIAGYCVRLRWLQQGKLPVYLLYIFIACTLLMAWSVLEGFGGG